MCVSSEASENIHKFSLGKRCTLFDSQLVGEVVQVGFGIQVSAKASAYDESWRDRKNSR